MTHTMEPPRAPGGTTVTSINTALGELSALLPGQVTRPGEAEWDQMRYGFNLAVDQQPAAVVTAVDEEDVVATVRWANRYGAAVTAQPVGHGATRATDGVVVLRTRGLREIVVDPERRVARVGAGAKWGEVLAATAPYGLTGLAGSSPDPSVAGFSLSGGLSWFGRAYGLAAHSIVGIDLVDPSGERRWVTAASNPDLFWALRGGGGDFGIAVALEIALHPAPHVYGGRLMWPIEMAWPVLSTFAKVTRQAPDTLTLWTHLLQFPPLPMVPEPMRGKSFVTIEATYLGSADEAEQLLAPFRMIPAMWADTMDTVQLSELGAICAEPEDPLPAMEFSGLLTDFDDGAVDALVRAVGRDSGSPLVVVQLRHLGGALARGTADEGPVGALMEPYQLFELGVPMAPELVPAIQAAFARTADQLAPYLSGRTSFTFLGSDDDPTRAFSDEALQRLQQVKRRVDPNGVIRSNRPVLRNLRS
ncbi:MAG: hypothetical protein QOD45_913 [Pseudonocardiales bacterium]|jgi:hypothetical protein|nr:hypothetical protein [Pseudonocardiales bacterium]